MLSHLLLPPLDLRWDTASRRQVNTVFDAREARLKGQIGAASDDAKCNQLLTVLNDWRTAHRTLMIENQKLRRVIDSPL